MSSKPLNVLYLDGFTVQGKDYDASDAIGYGITASKAIRNGLRKMGYNLIRPKPMPILLKDLNSVRLDWFLKGYKKTLSLLTTDPPHIIFIFHILQHFPAEIKRMLFDLGLSIPVIGYTHGSHWDPTDTFRFIKYPEFHILDLANLYSLDRILVVSHYMRNTLVQNISRFNNEVAEEIEKKIDVVGLPIDIRFIDRFYTNERFKRTTVVFNHSLLPGKNPGLFFKVMERMLKDYEVNFVVTRRLSVNEPYYNQVEKLKRSYPEMLVLGNTMSLEDYYKTLWMADIQVSTATHESLGIATLEAMYTQNCCILPSLGSYPEISDGIKEILYEYGEDGLYEKLAYFIVRSEERKEVATRLRQVSHKYSPANVVSNISKVIEGFELRKGPC
ncbi:MAG: hypothetical protein A3G93_10500 [Nitrospinae bacterium RIFCSPLOWO2_12_FULL_45_22]|nr:MAG: hypothetical protein A3G93_10500 [Nitrospinae bacterium RIFCSPLOWO2_12_FULL_45_22]